MDPTQPNMQPAEAPSYPPQVPVSTSNIVPPPQSPAEIGSTDQGLTQSQMKANLQELMDKVQEAYNGFSQHKNQGDLILKEQENLALQQIFDLLQSYGIDPSNVDEVSAFMDQIKQTDPELFQQLEKALNSILGGETPPVNTGETATQELGGVTPPPINTEVNTPVNMNINPNANISQNI